MRKRSTCIFCSCR